MRAHRSLRCALLAACLALGLGGVKTAQASSIGTPGESDLLRFQQREDTLFRTGYRLATANAPFCDRTTRVTGFLLHDASAYANPEFVRKELGLTGDIGVQSIAPGSPAQAAGIRQNDALTHLAGKEFVKHGLPKDPKWKRLSDARAELETALQSGPVDLTLSDRNGVSRTVSIHSVVACASQFELVQTSRTAAADGSRVLIGQDFPGFTYSDDEFAAAIAHELAHNILAHRATLAAIGRRQSNIRLSERDADRLMPYLLQNAGYDPNAAVRFMSKWGPRHGGGILRKRTHDGWDERVDAIQAELDIIRSKVDAKGFVDWRREFRPLLPTTSPR